MTVQETLRQPWTASAEHFPLDPADPIDALLVDYMERSQTDRLPTAASQSLLVNDIQRDCPQAARQLLRSHKGLLAVVAYPHKDHGVESEELLRIGAKGLLEAARTFIEGYGIEFSEHAVTAIEERIAEATGPLDETGLEDDPNRPMARMSRRVAKLQQVQDRELAHQKALEGFSPLQKEILPFLTLSGQDDIAARIGHPVVSVRSALSRCYAKTGTHSVTTLALELEQRGLIFDLVNLERPLVEILTDEEFEIGNNLELEYEQIAGLIGKGYEYDDIRWRVDSMKRKTGARSRTELALLVRIYDEGKRRTPEQILNTNLGSLTAKLGATCLKDDVIQHLLKEIAPTHSEAVDAKYLTAKPTSWKEVGDKLNISEDAARLRGGRGIKSMRKLLAGLEITSTDTPS